MIPRQLLQIGVLTEDRRLWLVEGDVMMSNRTLIR